VTGATGKVGGRIAARLAARGAAQRLIVRDPARAPRHDGAEVARIAGYHAEDDLRAAFAGLATLMLIPATESVDREQQHDTAVDAAVAAGVGRIVYTGFVGAAPDAIFTLARHHWATEQRIRESGVRFTILRMNLYVDVFPEFVSADGVIAGPAGDGRVGAVTRDDLAEVAAVVLSEEGHAGAVYDVTGPEALSLGEMAETMARASGKPIVYRDETLAEARASRAHYGAEDWQLEAWISTYTGIAAGEADVVSDTVERLTGHRPASLADYLARNPDALAHVRG
jgi:uncharacterized protein YbjT (DUF2867 family)